MAMEAPDINAHDTHRARPKLTVVERPKFSALPHAVLFDRGLSRDAVVLYAVLQAHWWQGGECWASHATLADEMRVKQRMLRYYLTELLERGHIVERLRGNGQAKAYAPSQAATDCQLERQEIAGSEPKRQEIAGQAATDYRFKRQEIATRRRRIEKDSPKEEDTKEVSDETSTAAAATTKLKVAFSGLSEAARAVVDDWRQKQGKKRPPQFNPTQAAYLEDAVSDLGVERLMEANTWAAQNGVPEFVKAIRAARTKRQRDEDEGTAAPASRPQPAPIKVAPATHRDLELWTAALADLRTMNNAANYETYLEPLEVAGRGADGGLRLICNPLMVDGLRRFKNQIASALASAGDEAPSSVGFAARRRALENNTDGD